MSFGDLYQSRKTPTASSYEMLRLQQIPLSVIALTKETLMGTWVSVNTSHLLRIRTMVETVTDRLRNVKSQKDNILQRMFQMFMGAHFTMYNTDKYSREYLTSTPHFAA